MAASTWERTLNNMLESGQLAVNTTGGSWVQPETKRIMLSLAGALRQVLKDHDKGVQVKNVQIKSSYWRGESWDKDDVCAAFGSVRNGFGCRASDLDINLQVPCTEKDRPPVAIAKKLADYIHAKGLFTKITRIFSANVLGLKLTDTRSNIEVDVCFNNYLAVINTKLLLTYCKIDTRVGVLGVLVKEWAKKHELVGTADGFLNSYAFMLLVIQFLLTRKPAVIPNLQILADEPNLVHDSKWGFKQECDTKFLEDADMARDMLNKMNLEKFQREVNKETPYELFMSFFEFYASRRRAEKMWANAQDKEERLEKWDREHSHVFNWSKHAACIRLYEPGEQLLCKVSSNGETNRELRRMMWSSLPYIEDPFDLLHNMGEKCLDAPRNHMLDQMLETWDALKLPFRQDLHRNVFPLPRPDCYLKFRVDDEIKCIAMSKEAVLARLQRHAPRQIYWPKGSIGDAYIHLADAKSRRMAHAENNGVIDGVLLNIFECTEFNLKKDTMEKLLQ